MKFPWKITAPFGSIDDAHAVPHQGIDLATPLDTPVPAPEGGIVERVTHEGTHGFGNAVWIREPDGYRIVFGHLDRVTVHRGERIHTGDIVGLSGDYRAFYWSTFTCWRPVTGRTMDGPAEILQLAELAASEIQRCEGRGE